MGARVTRASARVAQVGYSVENPHKGGNGHGVLGVCSDAHGHAQLCKEG